MKHKQTTQDQKSNYKSLVQCNNIILNQTERYRFERKYAVFNCAVQCAVRAEFEFEYFQWKSRMDDLHLELFSQRLFYHHNHNEAWSYI